MTPSKFFLKCLFILTLHMHRAEVLKPYLNAARWIPLAIDPYANLMAVFFTALQQDGVGVDEDLELEEPLEM
jgi:hypothetical protein